MDEELHDREQVDEYPHLTGASGELHHDGHDADDDGGKDHPDSEGASEEVACVRGSHRHVLAHVGFDPQLERNEGRGGDRVSEGERAESDRTKVAR